MVNIYKHRRRAGIHAAMFLFWCLAALPASGTIFAQQPSPMAAPQEAARPPAAVNDGLIHLDVVVAPPKNGAPVKDLTQADFTILDNKAAQTITSFRPVSGREAKVEVLLVVDAVNAGPETVSFERQQIDKFFGGEGGTLAYPTSLAVLTDKGVQMMGGFSADGKALSAALDKFDNGLRIINGSAGYYGAEERLKYSLDGLSALIGTEGPRPGRKLMIWLSPGWPLLSGPGTELDAKQQQQIFANVVAISTQLREGRITMYSINPLGGNESLFRASYYEDYVKGVSKPSQVSLGNLGLPVLAMQSGGLAVDYNNDLAGLMQRCVSDSAPYYEIAFAPAAGDKRDEYHHLEIKIAKPGLVARTRQGYYLQPSQGK
ncbi:MAG TPA: VWA domain-containing protein [Candidatus Acidoferrales bacterium]